MNKNTPNGVRKGNFIPTSLRTIPEPLDLYGSSVMVLLDLICDRQTLSVANVRTAVLLQLFLHTQRLASILNFRLRIHDLAIRFLIRGIDLPAYFCPSWVVAVQVPNYKPSPAKPHQHRFNPLFHFQNKLAAYI